MAEIKLISRIAALHELQLAHIAPELRKAGISMTTFQLLIAVANAGDDASQATISRNMGVSAATLSEAVHSQVTKGLLTQEPSPNDRRVKLLKLTPKAEQTMKVIRSKLSTLEIAILGELGSSDFQKTCQQLDRCIRFLREELK